MHTRIYGMATPATPRKLGLRGGQGEIAVSFTIASLVLMVVGTMLGLGVNKTQDVRTRAAGAVCGKICASNGECGIDATTKTLTACDFSQTPHRCKAVRAPNNPPCDAPEALSVCNQACKRPEDCSATDPATGIPLTCDLRSHTCQQKYVNDPRACPGYISPTPRSGSTGEGGSSEGRAFKANPSRCGVGFRVLDDPVISSITISPLGQAGGSFVVSNAELVDPSGTGWPSPIGYRMWKPASTDTSDNLTISWDPNTTWSVAGVPKGALRVRVKSGDPNNPNAQVNPLVDFYYWNGLPAWMKTGQAARITFSYYVTSGLQSKQKRTDYTQTATSYSCSGIGITILPSPSRVPSPSPTLLTPTPSKKRCFDECFDDFECGYTLGGVKMVCRQAKGDVTKRCLHPKSDSPTCLSPSVTPTRTPTPTETPTPTRGVTPTRPVTPTLIPCHTTIDFMIDASETTQKALKSYQQAITSAVRRYGADPAHKNDRITFYTSYFAKTVRSRSGGPFTAQNFSFPIQFGLHWTNMKAALESLSGNTIFISDGLPSIVDYGGGEKGLCVYSNGSYMVSRNSTRSADGCYPDETKEDGFRSGLSQCSSACTAKKYRDAYTDSLVTTNRNNIYGVFVNTGAYANRSFMEDISSEVIDVTEVEQKIGEIFDAACKRGGARTQRDREIIRDTRLFLQAADINHDGIINGIDYAICQQQIGADGQKSCDIIVDDLVNAQDISIVVERLGLSVQ